MVRDKNTIFIMVQVAIAVCITTASFFSTGTEEVWRYLALGGVISAGVGCLAVLWNPEAVQPRGEARFDRKNQDRIASNLRVTTDILMGQGLTPYDILLFYESSLARSIVMGDDFNEMMLVAAAGKYSELILEEKEKEKAKKQNLAAKDIMETLKKLGIDTDKES